MIWHARMDGSSTVSPDLAPTGQVPDIAIVDKSTTPHKIVLLELTCPWDSSASFRKAEPRKTDRYNRLTLDLQTAGFRAFPVEGGLEYAVFISKFPLNV